MPLVTAPSITELRERALNLLRAIPLFQHVSRRLLYDVVERSPIGTAEDGGRLSDVAPDGDQLFAFVVLTGTLVHPPGIEHPPAFAAGEGEPGRHRLADTLPNQLTPGVYLPGPPGLDSYTALRAAAGMTAHAMFVTERAMGLLRRSSGDILVQSPTLLRGLNRHGAPPIVSALDSNPRPELIWVAKSSAVDAPLEPLVHLLAGAVATDMHPDPTAIVTLGRKPEAATWSGTQFRTALQQPAQTTITEDYLRELASNDLNGHVFVTDPANTLTPPPRLRGVQFDRIVYVTDIIPDAVPSQLDGVLRAVPPLSGSSRLPYFSSFISSQIVRPRKMPPPLQRFSSLLGLGPVGEFETRTVSGDATDVVTNESPVPERLNRDACVLHFDVNAVQRAWNNWTAATGLNKPQAFLDAVGASHPAYRNTASRWARAVTNRRVGVAFSGGGASSYRLEPVAAQLENQGVPVDVFLGLSGGAFLGAYYVHAGLRGLHTAANRGLFFQVVLPSVMLSTLALRLLIDADVGWARVEDQELRFVAVTTELPHYGPPRVTAVVKGTLGEAAQASGTLPPGFAPTVKNGARYTDGGASTLVPSRIARDYGADVILACNSIAGPAESNPFGNSLLGTFLHDFTPVGRVIDFWAWYSLMWERTSRESAFDADVFVGFNPQRFPFLESVFWFRSWDIIRSAKREQDGLHKCVADLKTQWLNLGKPPATS